MRKVCSRLAMLVVVAVTIAAQAQNAPTKPKNPPATPSGVALELLHPGNGAVVGKLQAGIHQEFVTGWNFIHPENCNSFYYNGYFYVVVGALEGGVIWTTDPNAQIALAPACQTGNWLGFYVFDQNDDWSQLYTYTYR
jgi:hypothetical protein